jgi:group II intron reverse transcriptase/maturase
VTWQDYAANVETNLHDLHARVQRGAYRALPSRRQYIPKPDGRQRPLAVAALEDKIVQRATATLLNAIYEEDFLGFSYGFRPGRSAHHAMDALVVGIGSRKVNWILDADIRSFFDSISQEWLVRFLEHRIGDQRIIRLIQKWLKAGVLEDGAVTVSEVGTGQGSVISPLLANIYLFCVLDLYAEHWRRREASGDVIIVRYADDFIIGFEHETDAKRFLDLLRERMGKFALALHPEKTRLIEFGRHAAASRRQRGLGKPETCLPLALKEARPALRSAKATPSCCRWSASAARALRCPSMTDSAALVWPRFAASSIVESIWLSRRSTSATGVGLDIYPSRQQRVLHRPQVPLRSTGVRIASRRGTIGPDQVSVTPCSPLSRMAGKCLSQWRHSRDGHP